MKSNLFAFAMAVVAFAAGPLFAQSPESDSKPSRPNFLVIVADDMGFSDLGRLAVRYLLPTSTAWPTVGCD